MSAANTEPGISSFSSFSFCFFNFFGSSSITGSHGAPRNITAAIAPWINTASSGTFHGISIRSPLLQVQMPTWLMSDSGGTTMSGSAASNFSEWASTAKYTKWPTTMAAAAQSARARRGGAVQISQPA